MESSKPRVQPRMMTLRQRHDLMFSSSIQEASLQKQSRIDRCECSLPKQTAGGGGGGGVAGDSEDMQP